MEYTLNHDLEKRGENLYCESTVETRTRSIENPLDLIFGAFTPQSPSDLIITRGKGNFVKFGNTQLMDIKIPYTLVGELTDSRKVREVSLKNLVFFGIVQLGSSPIGRLNDGVYIPSVGKLCVIREKETEEYYLDDPKVKTLIELADKIREKYPPSKIKQKTKFR